MAVRWTAALAWLLLLSACASTHLTPIHGAGFTPETDEQTLWNTAAKLDERIDSDKLRYGDEHLRQYLQGVAEKLLPGLGAPNAKVRVFVLKDPFLNAVALPNGSVYLHMGILARMDDEAQLAMVMGHELTHFVERHAIKQMRQAQNRRAVANVFTDILAVAAVAGSGDITAAHAMLDLTGSLSDVIVEAQVKGYSRDLEREADERGLQAMVAAGYDPREAPKVFATMQAELEEAHLAEPYFFGSHPRLQERIDNCNAFLAHWKPPPPGAPAPRIGRKAFGDAVSQLLLDDAGLDMNIGRMAHARVTVERHLAHAPNSSAGYFTLGEVYRRSGGDANASLAVNAYEKAIQLDPKNAGAYRELGMLHRARGRTALAVAELARYDELAPEAPDRPIIEGYLEELRGKAP